MKKGKKVGHLNFKLHITEKTKYKDSFSTQVISFSTSYGIHTLSHALRAGKTSSIYNK